MSEAGVIDFGALETPTLEAPVETPITEDAAPVEETPTAEPGQDGPEKPTTETPAGGGKAPTLKAMRDAVKAFEQTNPELGKHLKTLLDNEGRVRAYQGEFPDVESARTLKAAVEAAGGIEGLSKLADLQAHVDNVNEQWDNGDPEALDAVFESGGEGAVKLLPHYMNRVEKENPQAFGSAIKPHLVRNLEGAGFSSVVGGILRVLGGAGTAEQKLANVQESIESMAQWFDSQKREAEKTNLDSLEPERGKLKEEWSKVTTEKNKIFENEVNAEVAPHMRQLFSQHMTAYSKALAALPSDAMRKNVAQAWLDELGKAFGKDHNEHMGKMMKAKGRNKSAIANYAKTRMAAVASEVTKKIVDTYKLAPGQVAPKTGGDKGAETPQTGVGSISSPIKVNAKPADSNIDWDADPDRMHFITGKAKLLTGSKQWVKWR